jgi:hypothetical protein
VAEQCLHRITWRDQPAHYDIGVTQLPVGQRVRQRIFGLAVLGIAPGMGLAGRIGTRDSVNGNQFRGPPRCLIERRRDGQLAGGLPVNTYDNLCSILPHSRHSIVWHKRDRTSGCLQHLAGN